MRWSHPNPVRTDNRKELCDLIVVFGDSVLIFSIKEAKFNPDSDDVALKRWHRKAVDNSLKQIRGAQRYLENPACSIERSDGNRVDLPHPNTRKVFRIAVALGAKGQVSVPSDDSGFGFVHIFDEISLEAVLREVDTISDFISYLSDKEAFLRQGNVKYVGEEDLLALFLIGDHSFPNLRSDSRQFQIKPELWIDFTNSKRYVTYRERNIISYIWDELIDSVGRTIISSNQESAVDLFAITEMAKEPRHARRGLAKAFEEFRILHYEGKATGFRLIKSPEKLYVFISTDNNNLEQRIQCLVAYCHVAGYVKKSETVVGISLGPVEPSGAVVFETHGHKKSEWSEEDIKEVKRLQDKFGWLRDETPERNLREYRFPN